MCPADEIATGAAFAQRVGKCEAAHNVAGADVERGVGAESQSQIRPQCQQQKGFELESQLQPGQPWRRLVSVQ